MKANDLTEVGQDFIDAVCLHNGGDVPLPRMHHTAELRLPVNTEIESRIELEIEALLEYIDPDSGYDDWLAVGMAIHHETAGSDNGFALFDRWSSTGAKYRGIKETSKKWGSFRLGHSNPVTMSTLKKMVTDNGHDWMDICAAALDTFEVINDNTGVAK